MKPILLTLFFVTNAFCQDSLYLVGTIAGESNAKRITDAKGIGDVNGDGYGDFMVTTADNTVRLHLGSSTLNLVPSVVFHYPGKDSLSSFGGAVGIGDVNGDGYVDFAIKGGFSDWGNPKGEVFIYLGGPNIDTIPKYEFHEPWVQDGFGGTIVGVGDINKDEYDDFAISSVYNWSNGKGRVYLFWGGDTISFPRSVTFVDTQAIGKPIDSFFGTAVASIGDINSDGFADIAISAGYTPSGPEKVYVYHGGETMATIPDTVLTSNNLDSNFGRIIESEGHSNNDGPTGFIIAGESKMFIYAGISTMHSLDASAFGAGGYISCETHFDINHDGYSDMIIGNTNYKNSSNVMVGGSFVYLGGAPTDTVFKYRLEGENKWDEFSKTMTAADVNGDGYDEVFIMSPGYPDYNSPLGKVYIYSYLELTDARDHKEDAPGIFNLYQNYPNPFNPNTTIRYRLPVTRHVSLTVYDILGRAVRTLANGTQEPGEHTVHFDGSRLSSGVYIYRLTTDHSVLQRAMLLLK